MREKKSLDEFLANINDGKAVFLSLSPQSRASFAVHFGLSPLQAFQKLTAFFKSLGVKAVYDTSCSRDLALAECCHEFISQYEASESADENSRKSSLPMISAACPGWICYAEKTLGSFVLPYISSVKSPQHLKPNWSFVQQTRGYIPCKVMPCYDKKLEAAMISPFLFNLKENLTAMQMITEVDSVSKSGEVLELMQLKSVDLSSLEDSLLDRPLKNVSDKGHLYGVYGGSGGYGDTVFCYAAKTLFGREFEGPLNYTIVRNTDFQEVSLEFIYIFYANRYFPVEFLCLYLPHFYHMHFEESGDCLGGQCMLLLQFLELMDSSKFALCYGFRNLQNIVRKNKTGKCDNHFLEVMACPSGCLNGWGQIKPRPGKTAKDLIQSLETAYLENVLITNPFDNPIMKQIYEEWLGRPGSDKNKEFLYTQYHLIEV
ncbi:LOW QUALITY PROTEIN: Iron hydrogenase, small subunit [Dillenia turbinata]|uniref:Iron hydrogenase, small subunit n=1 Tax=Dillenia turbinata TaxID=194707 RepID=A0AAN8UW37_9MAGN